MIDLPKVSILVPVYNRANLIIETLISAANQTYKNIEIIVVDNKSTDNTYELIQKFAETHPNVKAFQNEENIGLVRNWRKCLDYVTGEFVKILFSDDLIAPSFVERTLPYLTDHEDVGFVFTGTKIFKGNFCTGIYDVGFVFTGTKIFKGNFCTGIYNETHFIEETGIYDTKKFIEVSLLGAGYPVCPTNAIFRKKDVDKNLLLDVPNRIGSDFNHGIGPDALLYLLTAKDYPKFGFVSEYLAFFGSPADSISVSTNKVDLSTLRYIAKAYFVDNYVYDKDLEKKFDTRLIAVYLWKGRSNSVGLNSFRDFYAGHHKFRLDYKFLATLIIKKALSKIVPKIEEF